MEISEKAQGIVRLALSEDLGVEGDITTKAVIHEDRKAAGNIVARQRLVVCGQPIALTVFRMRDPGCTYQTLVEDGGEAEPGMTIGRVTGFLHGILSGERTALNFLSHLSGIATATRQMVEAARPYGIQVMDTRKTHPGMRVLEKYAVAVGGGKNHRMGLYDGILIKDNHLSAAGGVKPAVKRVRERFGSDVPIEVEAKTIAQVREALEAGADVIMLDNMDPGTVREAVSLVSGRAKVEVSGGIKPGNIRDYLITGVDFISSGFITMSAGACDISLELES